MPPPPLRGRGHNNVLLVTAEATVRSTGPSQTHQQHSTSNNVLLVTAEVTVHWALTNTRTFYYCVSKKPDFTNSQHLVIIFNSQLTMLKSFFNCRRCGRSPSPTAWFTQNGWASVVDSTADFLNSAQLPPIVMVTGNDGFLTKSLPTKHLHAQFVTVRQFSH